MIESNFLLDQQLAQTSPRAVLECAQRVADTHEHYGLSPDDAVIISTGALAIAGLPARPQLADTEKQPPMDTDVMSSYAGVNAIRINFPNPPNEYDDMFEMSPMLGLRYACNDPDRPLDIMSAIDRPDGTIMDFRWAYDSSQLASVEGRPDTYRILMPHVAAEWKLLGGRAKDAPGVLFAHAFGVRYGSEIVDTPEWQAVVARAAKQNVGIRMSQRPEWLTQFSEEKRGLAAHPAFAFLDGVVDLQLLR